MAGLSGMDDVIFFVRYLLTFTNSLFDLNIADEFIELVGICIDERSSIIELFNTFRWLVAYCSFS